MQAYLDVDGIVALAAEKGVDAIHPGYGFLSENPALPRACEAAGITFVGPSAELLELLGDKTAARRSGAEGAGCPSFREPEQPLTSRRARAQAVATEIGFPLIIKAAFGGGGRGMRVVDGGSRIRCHARRGPSRKPRRVRQRGGLPRALHPHAPSTSKCRSSATSTATSLHLYERDCSVQRRHQKVVEVAPPSNLDSENPRASARGCGPHRDARPATTTPAPSSSSSTSTRTSGSSSR